MESCVFARTEIKKWGGYTYFIRLDREGSFHTYPDVGGQYQSLKEAQMAIDRHLEERTHPKMKADDVSSFDMLIRRRLYWPDGTSRRYSRSRELESGRDEMRRLVLALLDNYNDVNYLVEDLAYELKEVSNYQSICEECSWYYHLNFIITSKADGDREVFVEVKYVRQGELLKMFVCCFCFIDPNDKVNLLFVDEGQRCNGCTIIGNVDMKRPDSSVELAAGHSNPYHQCCELVKRESDSEDEVFTAEN
nr:unnamed protein product [Digitaria exilis]